MRRAIFGVVVGGLLLTGCANNGAQPTLGKTGTGAAIGAGAGALIGNLLSSGRSNRTAGTLLGAAVGAAVGGGIGYGFDSQEQDFKNQLAAKDLEVQRVQDDLLRVTASNEISFATNSAEIKPAFQQTIQKLAGLLVKYNQSRARVIGYTDSTGSAAFNQQLSYNRAQSVVNALIGYGVPANRLVADGQGESNPRADNATAAGRQLNRRVEIFVGPDV